MLSRQKTHEKVLSKIPKSRVELHVHLDGALRHETIYELAKKKHIKLPGNGSLKDLIDAIVVHEPKDLFHFLQGFNVLLPCILDDLEALERISYEFCEDEAWNGVAYFEVRYAPHILATTLPAGMDKFQYCCEVVKAVNRGIERGESDFGIKGRSILCMLTAQDNVPKQVLQLCEKFRNEGVVGMDIAASSLVDPEVELELNRELLWAFDEARKLGIHRTVHSGESGPPEMVKRALDNYHAERIGHGYRVVLKDELYKHCLSNDIHFECCPWSSILTGSVPLTTYKHPIVQFAEDKANFSINSDDPTVTGVGLEADYELAHSWGFTEAHFTRINFNAAKSCFLPVGEKNQLLKQLQETYGVAY